MFVKGEKNKRPAPSNVAICFSGVGFARRCLFTRSRFVNIGGAELAIETFVKLISSRLDGPENRRCLFAYLFLFVFVCLVGWSVDCMLVGWLLGWSVLRSVGWMVACWMVAWLVGRSVETSTTTEKRSSQLTFPLKRDVNNDGSCGVIVG